MYPRSASPCDGLLGGMVRAPQDSTATFPHLARRPSSRMEGRLVPLRSTTRPDHALRSYSSCLPSDLVSLHSQRLQLNSSIHLPGNCLFVRELGSPACSLSGTFWLLSRAFSLASGPPFCALPPSIGWVEVDGLPVKRRCSREAIESIYF